jgi:hypothetical protein
MTVGAAVDWLRATVIRAIPARVHCRGDGAALTAIFATLSR